MHDRTSIAVVFRMDGLVADCLVKLCKVLQLLRSWDVQGLVYIVRGWDSTRHLAWDLVRSRLIEGGLEDTRWLLDRLEIRGAQVLVLAYHLSLIQAALGNRRVR